jgi:hypothetical protein
LLALRKRYERLATNAGVWLAVSLTHFDNVQRESFWSWRTKLPPAIVQTGPHSIHFDISMPIPKLYQVVYDTRAWMDKQGIIGRDVKAV